MIVLCKLAAFLLQLIFLEKIGNLSAQMDKIEQFCEQNLLNNFIWTKRAVSSSKLIEMIYPRAKKTNLRTVRLFKENRFCAPG